MHQIGQRGFLWWHIMTEIELHCPGCPRDPSLLMSYLRHKLASELLVYFLSLFPGTTTCTHPLPKGRDDDDKPETCVFCVRLQYFSISLSARCVGVLYKFSCESGCDRNSHQKGQEVYIVKTVERVAVFTSSYIQLV